MVTIGNVALLVMTLFVTSCSMQQTVTVHNASTDQLKITLPKGRFNTDLLNIAPGQTATMERGFRSEDIGNIVFSDTKKSYLIVEPWSKTPLKNCSARCVLNWSGKGYFNLQ